MKTIRHNVRRHKYNAIPTVEDGIKFRSKLECAYYRQLKLRKRAGDVVMFIRQPTFDIVGGTTYKADFAVWLADGTMEFVDVKGKETKEFIKAKKQVESLYPVKIKIVSKF